MTVNTILTRGRHVPGGRVRDNRHSASVGRVAAWVMANVTAGNPCVVHARIRDGLEITRAGACCHVAALTCRRCRNVVSGLHLQRRRRQSGERGRSIMAGGATGCDTGVVHCPVAECGERRMALDAIAGESNVIGDTANSFNCRHTDEGFTRAVAVRTRGGTDCGVIHLGIGKACPWGFVARTALCCRRDVHLRHTWRWRCSRGISVTICTGWVGRDRNTVR